MLGIDFDVDSEPSFSQLSCPTDWLEFSDEGNLSAHRSLPCFEFGISYFNLPPIPPSLEIDLDEIPFRSAGVSTVVD